MLLSPVAGFVPRRFRMLLSPVTCFVPRLPPAPPVSAVFAGLVLGNLVCLGCHVSRGSCKSASDKFN